MRKKPYTGEEIADNPAWGIERFQLFDLLKAGVQAFTLTGKKVVDRDPLLRKEFTLEYLKEDEWTRENLARGTEETGKVIVKGMSYGGYREPRKQLSRIQTDEIALRKFEKLPKIFWDDPEGCESISFSLPDDDRMRWSAIFRAMTFRYVAADVDKYFDNEDKQSHPLPVEEAQNDTAPAPAAPPEKPESSYFSKIGKEGGARKKKKQPILEAVKNFMQENTKTSDMSNERIARQFCKKYNEKHPASIPINKTTWTVYCSDDCIFFQIEETDDKKADKGLKSIKYNTLLNTYIPQAKSLFQPIFKNNLL